MKLISPRRTTGKDCEQSRQFVSNTENRLSIQADPLTATVVANPLKSPIHRTAKRTMDLLVSVPLVVLSLPLMIVVAAAIKCVSRGPVLYGQTRLGWGGKPFRMWKFRTMVTDAEEKLADYLEDPARRQEWNSRFKFHDDPRVLPVIGQFLRKSCLDELPQLWNVVLGDMSLVGPRPLPPYHIDQFSEEFRNLRANVPPGLTGLWQISSRHETTEEMFQKWDSQYVDNWSIWLDLQILSRTPWEVLSGNRDD